MKAEMWEDNAGYLRIYVTDDEDRVIYGLTDIKDDVVGDTWQALIAGGDPIAESWDGGAWDVTYDIEKIRATRDEDIAHRYDTDAAVLVAKIEDGREMTAEPERMGSSARHALRFQDRLNSRLTGDEEIDDNPMYMYTVTNNNSLRELCIKNGWFDHGTNEQYEKLFRANTEGCPIEEIATIIWLCTDDEKWSRRNILASLKTEKERFEVKSMLDEGIYASSKTYRNSVQKEEDYSR